MLKTGKVVTIASDVHVISTIASDTVLFTSPFAPVNTGASCRQSGIMLSTTAHNRVEIKNNSDIIVAGELTSGFYKICLTYIAAE